MSSIAGPVTAIAAEENIINDVYAWYRKNLKNNTY